jgi:two-component system LytT family response regulator
MKPDSAAGSAKRPAPSVPPLVSGKIKFNTSEGFEFIDPALITHIKGENNQCAICLTDKPGPLIVSYTMKELFDKKLLDPAVFLRVHKSYIVNTRYARRYLKEEGGKIILNHSDIEIPVSNSYRNEVMARIHAMN